MLDLLLILIALACAPYMVARMLRLPSPPSPRQIWRCVAPVVGPAAGLLLYGAKRLLAYDWQPQPHERPRWLRGEASSVFGSTSVELPADKTDRQTDERVSAASKRPAPPVVDRTRAGIIYTLLREGWTTSEMRPWLRGDNNTISAEIAEARKRLGLAAPERTLTVRDYRGEREIAL